MRSGALSCLPAVIGSNRLSTAVYGCWPGGAVGPHYGDCQSATGTGARVCWFANHPCRRRRPVWWSGFFVPPTRATTRSARCVHQSVVATGFSGWLNANASVNDGNRLTTRNTSFRNGTSAPTSSTSLEHVTTFADVSGSCRARATVGIRPTGCVSLRGRFTPPSVAANVVRRVLRGRTTLPVLAGLGLRGY